MLNKFTSFLAALKVHEDAAQTEAVTSATTNETGTFSTSMYATNTAHHKYESLISNNSWKPEREQTWTEALFGENGPTKFETALDKHLASQRRRDTRLGQSSASSKTLESADGTLWTGSIYMGTNNEAIDVVFDTGSDWLLVEGKQCSSCDGTTYDWSTSTAAYRVNPNESQRTMGAMTLTGSEWVDQVCVTELACIENFEFFMITDQTNIREPIDGFMGLARNEPFFLNSEDGINRGPSYMMALKNANLISEEIFSFYTAPAGLESYIDFGAPREERMRDPDELEWIELNEDFFWSADCNGFAIYHPDNAWEWGSIRGEEETVQTGAVYAVFDSGSPTIIIPSQFFSSFLEEMFDEMGGDEYSVQNGFLYSKCYDDFPTIYFMFDGVWVAIYPDEYVKELGFDDLCLLLLTEGEQPFFIFGTPIYMNYYAIHDTENNRLGFVTNAGSPHADSIMYGIEPWRVFESDDPADLPESAWSWVISSMIVFAFMCFWCCLTISYYEQNAAYGNGGGAGILMMCAFLCTFIFAFIVATVLQPMINEFIIDNGLDPETYSTVYQHNK